MTVVDGVLYGADADVGRWVQDGLGGTAIPGPYVALGGLDATGQLAFGVLFFNERDNDIEAAIYSRPGAKASRRVLRRVLAHAFDTVRALHITAEIETGNRQAIAFVLRLGFQLEGRKRLAGLKGDRLLYGLVRGECKFLGKSRA